MQISFENKIADIKTYRDTYNVGLKDAKVAVDAMWEAHQNCIGEVTRTRYNNFLNFAIKELENTLTAIKGTTFYGDVICDKVQNAAINVQREYDELKASGNNPYDKCYHYDEPF